MASKKNTPAPFVIDDESFPVDMLFDPKVGGERKGRGYDPAMVPAVPMFAPPAEMRLIPRSEWSERIRDQEKYGTSLEHVRATMNNGKPHASLDQNGQGYCWAYSVTQTVMYARGRDQQPYVRLSAHSVACVIKSFRDQGGWCGLSAEFVRDRGVAPVSHWPEKSMSRANDNPQTWAEAGKYTIGEDWVEMRAAVYDRNLTFDQVATCLLLNTPVAVDFNWWAHSVCAIRLVEVEPGSFGLLIQNSWTDAWGTKGLGVLRGNKAIPDGAVATRTVTVSG